MTIVGGKSLEENPGNTFREISHFVLNLIFFSLLHLSSNEYEEMVIGLCIVGNSDNGCWGLDSRTPVTLTLLMVCPGNVIISVKYYYYYDSALSVLSTFVIFSYRDATRVSAMHKGDNFKSRELILTNLLK